jgi:hypothetical protein
MANALLPLIPREFIIDRYQLYRDSQIQKLQDPNFRPIVDANGVLDEVNSPKPDFPPAKYYGGTRIMYDDDNFTGVMFRFQVPHYIRKIYYYDGRESPPFRFYSYASNLVDRVLLLQETQSAGANWKTFNVPTEHQQMIAFEVESGWANIGFQYAFWGEPVGVSPTWQLPARNTTVTQPSFDKVFGVNSLFDRPGEPQITRVERQYFNMVWLTDAPDRTWYNYTDVKMRFQPGGFGGVGDFDDEWTNAKVEGRIIHLDGKLNIKEGFARWMPLSGGGYNEDGEYKFVDLWEQKGDDPTHYTIAAHMWWHIVARWGNNPNVPTSWLERTLDTPSNIVKKGLDIIYAFEPGNEQNKHWKGRKGYHRQKELAAWLSAVIDGHNGTMLDTDPDSPSFGQCVFGMKTADPNCKVIFPGLAGLDEQYLFMVLNEMALMRGQTLAQVGNLFWGLSSHHYCNDAGGQSNTRKTGISPESDDFYRKCDSWVAFRDRYFPNSIVRIGEIGWDTNFFGQKADAFGQFDWFKTQTMWNIRLALWAYYAKLDNLMYYTLVDDGGYNSGVYGNTGLRMLDGTPKLSWWGYHAMHNAIKDSDICVKVETGNPKLFHFKFKKTDDNTRECHVVWTNTTHKYYGFLEFVGSNTSLLEDQENQFTGGVYKVLKAETDPRVGINTYAYYRKLSTSNKSLDDYTLESIEKNTLVDHRETNYQVTFDTSHARAFKAVPYEGTEEGAKALLPMTGNTVTINTVTEMPTFVIADEEAITAPTSVTDFVATDILFNEIHFEWLNTADVAEGIKVERKTGASGTYGLIATLDPVEIVFTDDNIIPDTEYYYRLKTFNQLGESISNEIKIITPINISPADITKKAQIDFAKLGDISVTPRAWLELVYRYEVYKVMNSDNDLYSRNDKTLRNTTIPEAERVVNVTHCYIHREQTLYKLVNNPTGDTTDTDWEVASQTGFFTGWDIELYNNIQSADTSGKEGSGTIAPTQIMKSFFRFPPEGGTLRISGLDNTKRYNLKLIHSKDFNPSMWQSSEVNGVKLLTQALYNSEQYRTQFNVTPSTGIIDVFIKAEKGGGYAVLNGLIIEEFDPTNVSISQPPVADAGLDISTQDGETITLNGGGSSDDNGISSYLWETVTIPQNGNTPVLTTPNTSSCNVTNLSEGTYVFRLTVTDSDSLTDQDTVSVQVAAAEDSEVINLPKTSKSRLSEVWGIVQWPKNQISNPPPVDNSPSEYNIVSFPSALMTGDNVYKIFKPAGYDNTTQNYPLLVFLVGSGEVGPELNNLEKTGPLHIIAQNGGNIPTGKDMENMFFMSVIHPDGKNAETHRNIVREAIAHARAQYTRIGDLHLTGISYGGDNIGKWVIEDKNAGNGYSMKSILPFSAPFAKGEWNSSQTQAYAENLHIWMMYGTNDIENNSIGFTLSHADSFYNRVLNYPTTKELRYSRLNGGQHNATSWNTMYDHRPDLNPTFSAPGTDGLEISIYNWIKSLD